MSREQFEKETGFKITDTNNLSYKHLYNIRYIEWLKAKNKELRDKIKMIISDDVGHKSDEKLRWILIDKVINT